MRARLNTKFIMEKLLQDIKTWAAGLLGHEDPANATVAEVHDGIQQLGDKVTDLKTAVTAALENEFKTGFTAQLDALKAQVTQLTEKVGTVETGTQGAATTETVEALTTRVAELENQLEAATTNLTAATEKITTLSGELATVKAGAQTQKKTVDPGLKTPQSSDDGGVMVIDTPNLRDAIFPKKAGAGAN